MDNISTTAEQSVFVFVTDLHVGTLPRSPCATPKLNSWIRHCTILHVTSFLLSERPDVRTKKITIIYVMKFYLYYIGLNSRTN